MKWLSINLLKRALVQIKLATLNGIMKYFPGLVRAIVARDQAGTEQVAIVQHALCHSCNPVVTLNFFSNESGYPSSTIWAAIFTAFGNNPEILMRLYGERDSISSRELRLRIEIKAHLNPSLVKDIDFSYLVKEYADVVSHSDKPQTLMSMLATLVVSKAPAESVEQRLREIGLSPSSLSEFQQVRFLTRLEAAGAKQKFIYWRDRLVSSLSNAARLKVALLDTGMLENGNVGFAALERGFVSLPFRISETYRDEIIPLYRTIPVPQNYLAARFDHELTTRLRSFLIRAIEEGEALSYLRLGDGECYGFADGVYVDEQGQKRQEEHWWGEQLDSSLRIELQTRFRDSVAGATVIGVPTVLRLIRDFNLTNRVDYPVNSLISRIICVMREASVHLNEKIVVEDQSNLFLFDYNFIDEIFSSAKKVYVISGVKADLIERWAPDRSKLHCIEIPTHRLLREGAVGAATQGILPHVYKRYLESIKTHAGPNVVFLVSAGFIGKIFVSEAAKRGAVALDVGQTLVSEVEKA